MSTFCYWQEMSIMGWFKKKTISNTNQNKINENRIKCRWVTVNALKAWAVMWAVSISVMINSVPLARCETNDWWMWLKLCWQAVKRQLGSQLTCVKYKLVRGRCWQLRWLKWMIDDWNWPFSVAAERSFSCIWHAADTTGTNRMKTIWQPKAAEGCCIFILYIQCFC